MNTPDRKPSYDNIVRIMKAFPKVSCRWFLLGKGSMFGGLDDFLPEANERVLHVMNIMRLNPSQMSVKTSIPASEYKLLPENAPSQKMLDAVNKAFPEISSDWLYKNSKRMLKNDNPDMSDKHVIRFYSKIKSGLTSDNKPDELLYIYGFEDCEYATFFFGDSLNGMFTHGDIVILKNMNTNIILNGELHLVVVGNGVVIRLIAKEDTYLRLYDNRLPDIRISLSDVKELYQIKGVIKRMAI